MNAKAQGQFSYIRVTIKVRSVLREQQSSHDAHIAVSLQDWKSVLSGLSTRLKVHRTDSSMTFGSAKVCRSAMSIAGVQLRVKSTNWLRAACSILYSFLTSCPMKTRVLAGSLVTAEAEIGSGPRCVGVVEAEELEAFDKYR